MKNPPYPDLRTGAKVGLAGGICAGGLMFLACYWMASLPAVTAVSLCYAFRPWWRVSNWGIAFVAFLLAAVGIGIVAACRPRRTSRQTRNHQPRR
jgi:hypothetical protein